MFGQEARHTMHDAALIEAGKSQDIFGMHHREGQQSAGKKEPLLSHAALVAQS
ncbi:hypothetical protein IMCC9480_2950 [Oxalobacteraceae bacterium IMCC9480]|nr:hypothetical protein IMCC9480_2950 [Oxalobacteraceae bacterium IMCC9480]